MPCKPLDSGELHTIFPFCSERQKNSHLQISPEFMNSQLQKDWALVVTSHSTRQDVGECKSIYSDLIWFVKISVTLVISD